MRAWEQYLAAAFCCILWLSAPLHAQPKQGAPQGDWDKPEVDERPPTLQFGCLTQDFCILGPMDVEHLPDKGGSLGFKVVGTTHITENGQSLGFKLFELFDISASLPRHPQIRNGGRLTSVNRLGFYNEATLHRYLRSRRPGDRISIDLTTLDGRSTQELMVTVVNAHQQRYATPFPEFVTSEQAARLAREQSIRAFLGAMGDIAPYALLFGLGTRSIPGHSGACSILGIAC